MICTTCNQEKANGKIVKGKFICSDCGKAARQKQEELITRYAIVNREGFRLTSAKYKETAKYYVLVEVGKFWPYSGMKEDKMWHGSPPGCDSPQSCANQKYIQALSAINSAEQKLKNAKEYLAALISFIKESSLEIVEPEQTDLI